MVTGLARRARAAFTLIELMIAVCIIGVLASVALPAYTKFLMSAQGSDATSSLGLIYKGAAAYWERTFTDGSLTSTEITHCIVEGPLAGPLPPMPAVPYKRTFDFTTIPTYAALGFSKPNASYFCHAMSAEWVGSEGGGQCGDWPEGQILNGFLAFSDIDGDGMVGGHAIFVFHQKGQIVRSVGFADVGDFMGGACAFCTSGID